MPAGIGLPEILIVLAIVLVIFGPKRLPQLGRSLGSGMREFKDSITGRTSDEDEADDERPQLTPAATAPPQTAAPQTAAPQTAAPQTAARDEQVSEPRG